MKGIIRTKKGKAFSTMEVMDLPSPAPKAGELKIKMASARINPVDMDLMKGFPTLKYKNPQIGGIDGAGIIEAVGENVTDLKVGDAVFFYRLFSDIGTWAEEVIIPASWVAKIPENTTPQEAGSVALPVLTAYESLSALNPQQGKRILIHGAAGGVGFEAVHLAKQMGLKIVANASEKHREVLERAGVEELIDYKTADFSEVLKQNPPDYVFDVLGGDTLLKSIALKPEKVVSIAFPAVDQMHKAGVKLPGILKGIMKLMGRKFTKAAQRNGVQLIGQVTGANGTGYKEAVALLNNGDYFIRPARTITLEQIEKNGMSDKDLGKTIVFSS